MTIASSDLIKAINSVWDASTLDVLFKALWSDPTDAEFPALHDQVAGGEQPFPYCIFEMQTGNTNSRMSAESNSIREIRDVPVNFRVHAREIADDPRTAKGIASYLVEEIMKVFGGHPTVAPTALVLDNGKFLQSQYQNDYSVRESEDNFQWIVSYIFRIDVPVMA